MKCVPDLKPDVHDVQVIVEVVFATIRTGVGAGAMTEKKRVGMYIKFQNFLDTFLVPGEIFAYPWLHAVCAGRCQYVNLDISRV